MKIDWCDGRWGALVPYKDGGPKHYTHFVSFTAPLGSDRSGAITATVIEWIPDDDLPTRSAYDLFRKHRQVRDALWRRLRARGFKIIKIKVRRSA